MRLKSFLLQEGRSEAMSHEETIDIISKHCQKALKGTPVYRGINISRSYMFVDPKKAEPRVSANTTNYYTYINDNSPYWKQYPKRSQSIICTTSQTQPINYGYTYRVFPYDGAKIGVCPKRDYWFSFYQALGDDYMLDEFNDHLVDMMNRSNVYGFNDDSYKKIVDGFKTFDMFMKDDPNKLTILKSRYNILSGYDPDKITFLEHIQKLLSPKKNKFQLKKIGDKLPDNKEVWTDSKSMLVDIKIINDVLKELL